MNPCEYCDDGTVEIHHKDEVDYVNCPQCEGRRHVKGYKKVPQQEVIVAIETKSQGDTKVVTGFAFQYRSATYYYGPVFATREECQDYLDGGAEVAIEEGSDF
jgi:DNA-directed RNA polymerase subunit RPC12/RpoP